MKTLIVVCMLFSPFLAYGQHFISGTDTTDILAKYKTRSLTISNPGASENLFCFKMEQRDVTITKITAVLQGSSSPSVTWSIQHGTDRSQAGTTVVSTTTNVGNGGTTTGHVVTSFSDPTVASTEFVWVTTSAYAGIVNALHLLIDYKIGL